MVLGLALLLTLAQNVDHPGQVWLGKEWGTSAQAAERGFFRYHDLWLEPGLEKNVRRWEREDAKEGLDWKHAYRTKSKYYRIETNVPRWRIELEIKPFLDALFETYERVFAEDFGLEGKAARNKDIRIYGSFHEYSVNEPENGRPRPRENPGFTVSGSHLVVYYDETDPGIFYSTVFHEGAHQFFISLLPGATPPIWVWEALATYFEGCTYSRATGTITPGFVPADRLEGARAVLSSASQKTPQELFLDVPQERFRGQEYCLAWSFVHYLIHRPGPRSRESFARFVRATNGSGAKPAAEIFAKATGESLEGLIPGWREYVLALELPAEIRWVVLAVTQDGGEGLRSRDLVWSFDGVEVFSAAQLDELWKARPLDRPYEVVVVRSEPDRPGDEPERRFVRVTVAPGSVLRLQAQAEVQRKPGLRD